MKENNKIKGETVKKQIFIFLFFLSIFLFCAEGHYELVDAFVRFEMTKNLVDKGTFELEKHPLALKGVNGKYYNKYGPLTSFIAIPFYLIAKLTAHLTHFPIKGIEEFFFSIINPILGAFIALIYFMLLKNNLKFEPKRAFLCCILLCFASSFFFYVKSAANEIPATLFFLLGIYFLFKENKKTRDWILGGVSFGLAYLTRWEAALFSVPVFLWIIYLLYKRKEFSPLGFLIGFLPFLIAGMVYTYYFFGNVVISVEEHVKVGEKTQIVDAYGVTAYTFSYPFFKGLYRTTFSLQEGLFTYNPFILFSFFGFIYLWRKREYFFLIVSWILMFIILYSITGFFIGTLMGPRYPLPLLPLFTFLSINYPFKKILDKIFVALVLISFFINFSGVNASHHRIHYKEAIIYGNEIRNPYLIREARFPFVFTNAFEVWRNYIKYPKRDYFFSRENASFKERLEKQATVALPNFWWVFLPFFGVPRVLVYMGMAVLLFLGIYSGYKIRKEILREDLTIS
jgi:hypothetical protein